VAFWIRSKRSRFRSLPWVCKGTKALGLLPSSR